MRELFGKVNWKRVSHFSPTENWGDIDQVSSLLVYSLDEYRKLIRNKVYLSPRKGAVFAKTGHRCSSLHYPVTDVRPCIAADVFPDCELSVAWMFALKSTVFNGVGIYPYWRWTKHPELYGGLHLDLGDPCESDNEKRRLWWVDENRKYYYLNTFEEIRRLFNILIYFK